jgi:hypothetical protein
MLEERGCHKLEAVTNCWINYFTHIYIYIVMFYSAFVAKIHVCFLHLDDKVWLSPHAVYCNGECVN